MIRSFIVAAAGLAVFAVPASAASTSYSPLDKYMLQSSIQGDRFEIAGGKLAQTKGATPAVKALGARLEKDHTKSLGEAKTLAKKLHISIPKTPTPSEEWEISVVNGLSGAAFDAAYTRLEVQDHKQDIEDTKTEISDGANAAVRALAHSDLPVLRVHLKLSKAAAAGG